MIDTTIILTITILNKVFRMILIPIKSNRILKMIPSAAVGPKDPKVKIKFYFLLCNLFLFSTSFGSLSLKLLIASFIIYCTVILYQFLYFYYSSPIYNI
jgi:hypothetical protein